MELQSGKYSSGFALYQFVFDKIFPRFDSRVVILLLGLIFDIYE